MTFLFGLGIVLLAAGVFNIAGAFLQIIRCSQTVTGRVAYVDTKPEIGASRGGFQDCYVPVYEYEVDGKVYQHHGAEYSSRPDFFKLDEQRQVRYNPNDPNECMIDQKSNKLVIGAILLLLGAALLFFA